MKKIGKVFSFITLLTVTCGITACSKKTVTAETTAIETSVDDAEESLEIIEEPQVVIDPATVKLQEYIKKMPLAEKVAQLFIINLDGNKTFRSYETYSEITGEENEIPLVAGGYLFFSYNLADSIELTKDYIDSIRKYTESSSLIQPFLAIDQEGGSVNRLRNLTGGLPSQERVALNYTLEEAYELYSDQAAKMSEIGFDMNLAPVVEICTPENKDFLMGRSFGDAEKTEKYSLQAVSAYEDNRIGAVIKHFPGNTNTDPHTGLPVMNLNSDELFEQLEPFKKVIEKNPSGVLMSHAITSAIDEGVPSCLSKLWVTDILRNKFNFQGIVFSDDIFMGALADNGYPPEVAAVKAIEAGIDCIMISEKRFAKPAKIIFEKAKLDSDFEQSINDAVFRILNYKIKKGLFEINEAAEE